MGSSHTAAVKQAWSRRLAKGEDDGYSLTFFASKTLTLKKMALRGHELVPENKKLEERISYTSGGLKTIDLDRYDAFMFVALGFKLDLIDIWLSYAFAPYEGLGSVSHVVSRACFGAVMRAMLEESVSLRLADKIRSVSSSPILICPRPFPPENVLDRDERYRPLRDPVLCQRIFDECVWAAQAVADRHDCQILWPPDDTMGLPGFTKSHYGLGAIRIKGSEAEAEDDGRHMNEAYGELVLGSALKRLKKGSDLGLPRGSTNTPANQNSPATTLEQP